MKFIDKKKLSTLLDSLQSDDSVIQECSEVYKAQGLSGYTAASKVPASEAYEIYKRRSEYPPDEGNRVVSGYDYLLKNLQSFDEKTVKIHSFGMSDATFVVFTDCAVLRLLGVVLSKERVSDSGQKA